MDGGEGAWIPYEGTSAVVATGVSYLVDITGGGDAPEDGTIGAKGAEVNMKSDTRLLEPRLHRLY
jgi:hypothetical protein